MRLVFIRCETENSISIGAAALLISARAESSSAKAILGLKKSRLLTECEEWKFENEAGHEVSQTGQLTVKHFPRNSNHISEELAQHIRVAGQPEILWVEGAEYPPYLRQIFELCPRSFKIVYAQNTSLEQIAQLEQYDLCLVEEEWQMEKIKNLFPGVFCAVWDKVIDDQNSFEKAIAKLVDILQLAGRQFKATKTHKEKSSNKRKVVADQNLPRLREALNVEIMAPAFEDFLRREYPEHEFKVIQLYIGKINHKPGQECNILYGLFCRDREHRHEGNWFYATMRSHGAQTEAQHPPATWPGCRFWKPVSFWPEMDMVLHAFPYDPELPYLGQLTKPDFIKRQVEENLSGLGLSSGWQCREVNSRMIKYMPHKRCVLRYELVMVNIAGHERRMAIYGKTYDSAESDYIYRVLQKITASLACANGALNVPQPVAHLAGANTIWQLEWKGENLSRMAEKFGWVNLLQTGILLKIASMLAAFHQIPITGLALKRGPSLATILENARGDANDIQQHLPESREALAQIIAMLAALTISLQEPLPQATIHGTFKIAQILCRDDELAVVDFDSIACGDPHYDLAELLASLVYLQVSDGVPPAALAEGVEQLLSAYQKTAPWACERRRLAWYVVAFLLGKIHSSLKRAEAAAIKNMEAAFALLQNWLAAAQS